jgi:pyrophosphatase PpaX
MSRMKSYKYVLLDWDGSLARTLDVWLAALKAPLQARGYDLSDAEIGANFAIFEERMIARGIADVAAIIAEATQIATREVPNVALYPQAVATLKDLRRSGKKVSLVTTSRHAQIDPLLAKYELQTFFDLVICGDDVQPHKPHPAPIQKAIALLGGTKEEAVMIGDSDNDIIAATSAGIDSILFFPPEHAIFYDIETLKRLQPTHIVDNFHDIMQLS